MNKISSQLNTIDRCFKEAQDLLVGTKSNPRTFSDTFHLFIRLQPIMTDTKCDNMVALLALAFWKTRSKVLRQALDFGKGVEFMNKEKESLQVRAGSRTYFFDLKETQEGKPYLVITESRFMGEGKERERISMAIFQEHAGEFSKAVAEIAARLE